MKCEICEQEKSIKHHGTDRVTYICINSKCPEYFEPALRIHGTGDNDKVRIHPTTVLPSEPVRGHGIKLDNNKPPVFTEFLMQFPRAIRLIALVGDEGTKAPGHVRSGWKGVEQGYLRYSDAAARHMLDEAIRGTEPGTADIAELIWQAATVTWNNLARLEHLIRENRSAAERLDPTAEV